MNTDTTASCTCGSVRFRSEARPVAQFFCHCADCRQATGGKFARVAFFRTGRSEISGRTTQAEFTARSGSRTTRESCAACGSLLFDRSEGFPMLIGVMAERIAAPFVFEPLCHVWAAGVDPSDLPDTELPRYDEGFPT